MTPGEARRVLGLPAGDHDPDTVRRAYRAAVRRHHPDRPGGDAVRFRRSVLAFELLAVPLEQAAPTVRPPRAAPVATDRSADPIDAATGVRLDLLMYGLDRVGEVTYLDRSLALVEGVLPHPAGALQVLIAGTQDGSARVVDVTRLGGGDAPTSDEIQRLLTRAADAPDTIH